MKHDMSSWGEIRNHWLLNGIFISQYTRKKCLYTKLCILIFYYNKQQISIVGCALKLFFEKNPQLFRLVRDPLCIPLGPIHICKNDRNPLEFQL